MTESAKVFQQFWLIQRETQTIFVLRLCLSYNDNIRAVNPNRLVRASIFKGVTSIAVFTDVETGEKYRIGYITQGVTERIKLERGKWYKVAGGGNLTLNPVNIRVE